MISTRRSVDFIPLPGTKRNAVLVLSPPEVIFPHLRYIPAVIDIPRPIASFGEILTRCGPNVHMG